MRLSKDEAIKILSRYDNEYYTQATRQAHRMGAEALKRVAELEEDLRLAIERLRDEGCATCVYEPLVHDEHPCNECTHAGGLDSKWEWAKPEQHEEV